MAASNTSVTYMVFITLEQHKALISAMTNMLAIPSANTEHSSVWHLRTYLNKNPSAIFGVSNIIKNNIFLRPEKAMLNTWQKLVSKSIIFFLQRTLEHSYTFSCYKTAWGTSLYTLWLVLWMCQWITGICKFIYTL